MQQKESVEELIYELALRMRIVRAVQQFSNKLVNEKIMVEYEEINERECLVLEFLGQHKGHVKMADIKKFFFDDLAISTISSDITNLAKRGWIEKKIDIENQRARIIELTDMGNNVLNYVKQQQSRRFALLIRALGLKGEEANIIKDVIKRAIEYLDGKLASVNE